MDLKLLLEGLKLGNNVNNVNDKERIITYLNQLKSKSLENLLQNFYNRFPKS